MSNEKTPTPFSHVTQIYKKNGEFKGGEGYVQFIINKELSKNGELIEVVNEAQRFWDPAIPNELHFKLMNGFYPYSRRPGFKQFPWIWKGSTKADPEVVGCAKYYEESIENAKVMVDILKQSKDGKKHLKWLAEVYGGKKK